MQERRTIIPKGEPPKKMPSGLQTLYAFGPFGGEGELLTEESLKKMLKQIRKAKKLSVFLGYEPDLNLEDRYMQIEVDNGCIAFAYVVHDGLKDGHCFCCFDPDYLDSDEESPMVPGDGQSVLFKRDIIYDAKLAAACVEYFARTGELYPGMAWLKEEWV